MLAGMARGEMMADISIGAAVGEGFGLIRRKPISVLAWGFCQIAVSALGFAMLGPVFMASLGQLAAQSHLGAPPSPQVLQTMTQAQGLTFLLDVVALLVNAVIACAVFRAVIHPDRPAFAYLRIGAPELFLMVVIFGAVIAYMIGLVIAIILIGIVVGILTFMHAPVLAGLLAAVGGIAAFVLGIWFVLRISLIGPMMVDDGKFHLEDAWRLTRGKTWGLFAIGLLVFLLLMAIYAVVGLLMAAIGIGAMSVIAGGLANAQSFFQQAPGVVISRLAPALAVLTVIWIPVAGGLLAIMGAPWARAYLDLRPERDVAETFA